MVMNTLLSTTQTRAGLRGSNSPSVFLSMDVLACSNEYRYAQQCSQISEQEKCLNALFVVINLITLIACRH